MAATEVTLVVANLVKDKKGRKIIIGIIAVVLMIVIMFLIAIISLFSFLAPSDDKALKENKYYIEKEKIKQEYNINNDLNVTYPQMLSMFTTNKVLENDKEINKLIIENFVVDDEEDNTIKDDSNKQSDTSSDNTSSEDTSSSESSSDTSSDAEQKKPKRFKYENEIQDMFREKNISEENILLAFSLAKYAVVKEILDFGGNGGKYPSPVASGHITTEYGNGVHPITHLPRFHNGLDIAGAWHQKVATIADGKVYKVNYNRSGYGNYIIIKHDVDGETFYTLYAHLSKIYVYENDEVKQGQMIALEGGQPNEDPNPGNSTGHHLHFSVLKTPDGATSYDPHKYISLGTH